MRWRVHIQAAAVAGLAVAGMTMQGALAFPDKPVKLVVPYPPGGLGDSGARIIAQSLSVQWKQPVTVENKPGVSSIIGAQTVIAAPRDGHTLYLCNSQNAMNEVLYKTVPYKLADIAPVSITMRFPFAVLATPGLPANNIAELIDYARKNPGKLNFATFGPSSTSNFLAKAFARQHGLQTVEVPYKGTSQVIPDLMTGTVQVFFDALGPSMGLIKEQKLKALGVNSAERLPLAPELATMKEQGFALDYQSWFGICTTTGAPADALAAISDGVRKAVASDEYQTRVKNSGALPVSSSSPAEFSQFMHSEIDSWGKIIRPLDITLD